MKSKKLERRLLPQEIASRTTDPHTWSSSWTYLPNPDTVLQKLGVRQEVYQTMYGDPHIIGELRPIRAALLGFEHKLQAASEAPADLKALELCQKVFARPPATDCQWADVIWQMGMAVFHGLAVHEVVWKRDGDYLMPSSIIDRPQRRFVFGTEHNELRILTKNNLTPGELAPHLKFLVSRHMASFDNPYGVAVFSACYWPYIFKHQGFRYFVQFAEKFGTPWVIGKYPAGTPEAQQHAILDSLENMVEASVGVIPSDAAIDTLDSKATGTPQMDLIKMCNKELSKALTSQTLSTEIDGSGSKAAAETHSKRQDKVTQADRRIIEATMNTLCEWVTQLNIPGAQPPKFVFYEESESRISQAEFLQTANSIVPLSKSEIYQRLGLSPPKDTDDTMDRRAPAMPQLPGAGKFAISDDSSANEFRTPAALESLIGQASDIADPLIEQWTARFAALAQQFDDEGRTIEELRAVLPELMADLPEDATDRLMEQALQAGFLQGMDNAAKR